MFSPGNYELFTFPKTFYLARDPKFIEIRHFKPNSNASGQNLAIFSGFWPFLAFLAIFSKIGEKYLYIR